MLKEPKGESEEMGRQPGEHDVTDIKGEEILKNTCYVAGTMPGMVGIHLRNWGFHPKEAIEKACAYFITIQNRK